MTKTVNCPTGCGAEITAEIGTAEDYTDVFCKKCGKKVRILLNKAPVAFSQCLDPRAEAFLAKVLPQAVGKTAQTI